MADYTPFPLSPWYDRPNVSAPVRTHKMMAAGPDGSGGVASEMLSVDQVFSLMVASDLKPFADPLTKREAKTANYAATVDDNGKIIAFTVTGRTLTMPAAASAAASAEGYMLVVSAQVGTLTITRSGTTDTIVGATSITLNQGETAIVFLDAAGTGWRASIAPPYNTVARTDIANVFTQRQHWAKGTNIASAASIALPSNGNFFDVSGTTTVTAISTVTQAGTRILLRATGAWTLQHNAASMILPRAANITLAVGDIVELISLGSGNYLLMNISKVDGTALTNSNRVRGAVLSLSGASNVFPIPAAAQEITIALQNMTTSVAAQTLLQLSTSAGYITTGYTGSVGARAGTGVGGSAMSSSFLLQHDAVSSVFPSTTVRLSRLAPGSNIWMYEMLGSYSSNANIHASGYVNLGDELTAVRLTTAAGTATFSGSAQVSYLG